MAIWQRLAGIRGGSSPRWITSDVAVWAAGERGSWQKLRDAGVRSALDLRTDGERAADEAPAPPGFTLRRFPIDDYSAPCLSELVDLSDWVVARIGGGSRVVIGCREGRSRSALVACATLIRLGYSPADAYRLVRQSQSSIALSDLQIELLEELTRSAGVH